MRGLCAGQAPVNAHKLNLRVEDKLCKLSEETLGTLEAYIGG